jgi:hypothetical protein
VNEKSPGPSATPSNPHAAMSSVVPPSSISSGAEVLIDAPEWQQSRRIRTSETV